MTRYGERRILASWVGVTLCLGMIIASTVAQTVESRSEQSPAPRQEAQFLTSVRQLTFEGRRAGEGYFGPAGRELVFQSERLQGNPFFQIFVLDMETGDTEQISPGQGKTTCAWLHPQDRKVLFASSHDDPEALSKQRQELEDRAAGKERRYTWDYDPCYELYEYDRDTRELVRLTDAQGYDAEGSWSPDGAWIAFASNRHAYELDLTDAQREVLERDPSFFAEIYLMRHDGSDLRRLTHTDGYDGGPFFSPDGSRICWRRFSPDGALAEIMTMRVDGTDVRQLTRLGAMSWAPFYHPSGEYLIFTTNKHGFGNFELYVVDVNGLAAPQRVTCTDGFDGLPAFSPDGLRLAWTSNRTTNKQSQIFIADWNHAHVMELLGVSRPEDAPAATVARDAQGVADAAASDPAMEPQAAQRAAREAAQASQAGFLAQDILRHVGFLCRPELEGRLTGTRGEQLATAYVAAYLDSLGLEPAGDDGSWFQTFDFTSGISLGASNRLVAGEAELPVDETWRPLSFSASGDYGPAEVVFAGYGISAPAEEGEAPDRGEYDSFVHLDVQGKWVLSFRFMPEGISAERRQHLARYSSLRFKAMKARDLGALGLIVVSGPTSRVNQQLVPLKFDGSLAGSSLPVISVTDEVAAAWVARAGKNLETLQQACDGGQPVMGFAIPDLQVRVGIDLQAEKEQGRNVLGRLPAVRAANEGAAMVIVGAHIDHLGRGTGGSLARDDESDQIHFGADDNSSGVAAMLEIAEYLADQRAGGQLGSCRDVLFAAWSGEELGLLGSSHFAAALQAEDGIQELAAPAAEGAGEGHGSEQGQETQPAPTLRSRVAACLNLDMVGRLEQRLVLQGVGSSSHWLSEIEQRNAPLGLPIVTQNDSYLPTDSSSFFVRGVPVLSAFTGTHPEYHTPRDTPDRLNFDGTARVAHFMGLVTRSLARSESPPDFVPQARQEQGRPRAGLRAYLGTIPDYGQSDQPGVALSGVAPDGPAARAGVRGGDLIVELAGKKIENIYDYTYAIEALKIGQPIRIVVLRDGKSLTLDVTPGSRE